VFPVILYRPREGYFDFKAHRIESENPRISNGSAEVFERSALRRATREGYCCQHVQAITVAIDQYGKKALKNRDYLLNKPYGVG